MSERQATRWTGRRRRTLRRCVGLMIALVVMLMMMRVVDVIIVRLSHKALAVPWTSVSARADDLWSDLPLKCKRRLVGSMPTEGSDAWELVRARSVSYANMGREARERGIAAFDVNARATQGLRVDDMFTRDGDGKIKPNLLHLDVPVRAIVIPFPVGVVSAMLHRGTLKHLAKFGFQEDVDVYVQNEEMFHASMFHVSHHIEEHAVSASEALEEERRIRSITTKFCPINAVLERVTVTSGGVVLAGWQVARDTWNSKSGEPSEFRAALRDALPKSPTKQLVSDVNIIHTTLARLTRPPKGRRGDVGRLAKDLAFALTDELCGLEITLDRAWFVREHHKLALALRGAVDKVDMPFECHSH